MYLLLFFVLVAAGVALAALGRARGRASLLWSGIALAVATVLLFSVLDFWGEVLWFEAVGFAARLWTFVGWQAAALLVGALIAGAAVAILNTPARRLLPIISPWAELVGAAGGGVWGLGAWQSALLFFNRTSAGVSEPILGLDAGFYLFTDEYDGYELAFRKENNLLTPPLVTDERVIAVDRHGSLDAFRRIE